MKKNAFILLIIAILTIIDNTIMPIFKIGIFYPSLLFVFLCSYSILNGSMEGIIIGVIIGLSQDLFFTNAFGINSLINAHIGLLAGYIGRNLFKERYLIPVLSIFVLSFIKGISIFIMLYYLNKHPNGFVIIFTSFYNMLVGILGYGLVYNLCKKEFMVKDWKF